MDTAERRRRDCEVRLQVAAPAVTFAPEEGRAVRAPDGAPVAAAQAHRVVSKSRYVLDGFGAVVIEPGGGAADLESELRQAQAALDAVLRDCGAASEAEARQAYAERQRIEAELKLLTARFEALVPDGIEAARGRLRAAEAAVARLAAAIATASGGGDQASASTVEDDGEDADEKSLLAALEQARRASATADRALDAARREGEASALRRVKAESDLDHARRQAERLAEEAQAAEATRPRATLVEELARADEDREAKRGRLALKAHELGEDGAKTAELRRSAAERTLRQITATVQQLRDETIGLEAEVRVAGGSGLGEAIQLLGEQIADLERRRTQVALEADASRLLYKTLLDAQRTARERWLGPIKTRVAPFMKLIHPESDIDLDEETLELKGLTRAGVAERFDRLSAGAREQVAVVTRLALAQVLKHGGHPATVILDDALVNTDEIRLERMHHVLREAARDLQVVVLTCRERDFRGLGAPMFRV